MDYDDYDQQEEFSEDILNDDDYDALQLAFPILSNKLSLFKPVIPEIVVKETLYNNYFDVDQSFLDLKKEFKLKGTYKRAQGCLLVYKM